MLAALPLTVDAQRIITFDAPNAGTTAGLGTEPSALNAWATVTGDFSDNKGGVHGFVRTVDGRISVFDVPGAKPVSTGTCAYNSGGTCPTAINDFGTVTGFASDSNSVFHGFVRTRDGNITEFDGPGARVQGTYPLSVNNGGTVTGSYTDANGVGHGFLRFADGRILTFDDPAAGTAAGQGTFPDSINDAGEVTGGDTDANNFTHGFVRAPDGTITNFDPPTSVSLAYGAFVNNRGVIAGDFYDAGYVVHGFERSREGEITEFQVPDAGTGGGNGAWIWSINSEGTIVGFVVDNMVETHSFIRYSYGGFVVFDIPGQFAPPGSFTGGGAFGINDAGVVVGHWTDLNSVEHGYLRLP
jgi:hypothetical protein